MMKTRFICLKSEYERLPEPGVYLIKIVNSYFEIAAFDETILVIEYELLPNHAKGTEG